MSGLDVASGAVSIASLGIEVCRGLLSYYEDWKDYNSDIANAYHAIADLSKTLGLLKGSLKRKELDYERFERVKTCLRSCEDGLKELSKKLQDLRKHGTPEGLRERAFSKAQRMWYPFRAKTLTKLRQNVDGIQERLQLALQALQLDVSITVGASVAQIAVQQQSDHFKNIIDWLSPPDPWTNHASARKRCEAQTGEWLLQCDQYKAWKAGASKHMWVYGSAGCGKTILCSTAVEDIQSHCQTTAKAGLVIFYFSFSDDQKQTYDNLMRSLVTQLGWKEPGLSMLRQAYEKPNCSVPGVDELEKILCSSMEIYNGVFLLLDALDECYEESDGRQNVLRRVEGLAQRAPKLNILVTSRELPEIRESMELLGADQIAIAPRAVNADILRYVSGELSRDRGLAKLASSKTVIEETIAEKADGMFRWAYCQLQELKRLPDTRPSYVRKALHGLPTTLDDTYTRMLTAIKEEYRSDALTLLHWLAYARSPPNLSQLVESVLINFETDRVDFDDRGDLEGPLNVLTGLVTIVRPKDNQQHEDDAWSNNSDVENNVRNTAADNWQITSETKVRLAHFSVKEYLESPRVLHGSAKGFHLKPATGHWFISQSCLTYIIHYSKCDEKTSTAEDLVRFPLIQYAAQSWYHHSSAHQHEEASREEMLLSSAEIKRHWLLIHDPDRPYRTPFNDNFLACSGLYYASLFGLEVVAASLIKQGYQVNAEEGFYHNALQAASYQGHTVVVKLLLKNGANANAKGGPYGTALQAASKGGHTEIVKLLLQNGANVNAWEHSYDAPLKAASDGGHTDIVKLLLENGANINADGSVPGTNTGAALRGASGRGHTETVKLLLENGANVNTEGDPYGTALQAASERGRTEVVKLLLENGANANAEGGHLGIALQVASQSGYIEIVRLLLRNGANVNAEGGHRNGTALQDASNSGHIEIVKLLLENGANINTEGGFHGTALRAASISDHIEIVRLLLKNGANVNPEGSSNRTALEAASNSGHIEIAKLLLENGANVNAEGGHGDSTALRSASDSGHIDIVKLLLENGANVNAEGGPYHRTALQAASERGHLEIVKLLLEKGANINAKGEFYGNALEAASFGGHTEVVKLLLKNGATGSKERWCKTHARFMSLSRDSGVHQI